MPAHIVEQSHETVYGERQHGAADLAGHHGLFSRHASDLNPTDWSAMVSPSANIAPQVSLSAMLSVRHGARAVDFYNGAFGAKVLFRFDGDNGEVIAELSLGDHRFWVTDESPQNQNFSPESLGGGTVRMELVVADPAATFHRALAASATTVWPVAEQSYRWCVRGLVDPFGHHWEIGKPLS